MKTNKIFALILCILMSFACFSCEKDNVDISGYYTANRLNNVYYFSDDGKIYENYLEESRSCYEIDGDVIKLYNEESPNVIMEFDFKKTKGGFIVGDLEYTKIEDPIENLENNDIKLEESVQVEQAPEEESKEIADITGYYTDDEGYTYVFAEDGMYYEKGSDTSDIEWEYDGEVLVFRNVENNKVEINGLEIIEGGIKIGDKVYLSME